MTGLLYALGSFAIAMAMWVLWFKKALRQALPENLTGFVLATALGLGLAIAAFFQAPGLLGGVLAGLATFLSLFWFFALIAGKQKAEQSKIAVGQAVPAFTALNEDGSSFDSQVLHGKPYLLKFFRGHW